MPLKALLAKGCLDPTADVIADCKSGVSGAGKSLAPSTHFASVHDDFRAYALLLDDDQICTTLMGGVFVGGSCQFSTP